MTLGEIIPKNEIIKETAPETSAVLTENDILNPNVSMKTKIALATDVADALTDILETQGLSVELKKGQPKYVTAEGWNTLGTILGTYARTEEVLPLGEGIRGYKARVSIMRGDEILSTAEAIATAGGFQKDQPAIYSMAQTRAMGKAYRMAFSWIIKLAGYSPTPAEEMRELELAEKKANAKAKQSKKNGLGE